MEGEAHAGEERGIGEALVHKLEAHEAAVHAGKRRPAELHQIHFDPVASELIH